MSNYERYSSSAARVGLALRQLNLSDLGIPHWSK